MSTKHFFLALPLALGALTLGACNDGDLERAGNKADNAIEKAGDKIDNAAEKVGDGIDDATDGK